mmetsp:Transcript_25009/g.94530  ORF Transcript_25009/g.94530 Transcript_25009/m.94530 type:complete len:203 (+) Transcript_25009:137-745(+)
MSVLHDVLGAHHLVRDDGREHLRHLLLPLEEQPLHRATAAAPGHGPAAAVPEPTAALDGVDRLKDELERHVVCGPADHPPKHRQDPPLSVKHPHRHLHQPEQKPKVRAGALQEAELRVPALLKGQHQQLRLPREHPHHRGLQVEHPLNVRFQHRQQLDRHSLRRLHDRCHDLAPGVDRNRVPHGGPQRFRNEPAGDSRAHVP